MFSLSVALDAGIGRYPDDGAAAENRAFEIGDLHGEAPPKRE